MIQERKLSPEQFLREYLKKKLKEGTIKKLHEWDNSVTTEEIIKIMSDYAQHLILPTSNDS